MAFGPLSSLPTQVTGLGNAVLGVAQLLNKNVIGIQPQSAPLSPGVTPVGNNEAIIFDYEGEQSITLKSDITDHFIETNSAVQDQIALKPEMITTHGFIAELNDILPAALQPLQTAANTVQVLSAYAPTLSVSALVALNEAVQSYNSINQLANTAVSAVGSLGVLSGLIASPQNKQQTAFNKLYGYWLNRTLFTVQTPWQLFVNCAIDSMRPIQDADTQLITDFEMTFKALKFSSTVIAGGLQLGQAYFNNYLAQNTPNLLGTSTPTDLGASFTKLTGGLL